MIEKHFIFWDRASFLFFSSYVAKNLVLAPILVYFLWCHFFQFLRQELMSFFNKKNSHYQVKLRLEFRFIKIMETRFLLTLIPNTNDLVSFSLNINQNLSEIMKL